MSLRLLLCRPLSCLRYQQKCRQTVLSVLCVCALVLTKDNSGYCLPICLSDTGRRDADHSITHPPDRYVSTVCRLFTSRSKIYLSVSLFQFGLICCREICSWSMLVLLLSLLLLLLMLLLNKYRNKC